MDSQSGTQLNQTPSSIPSTDGQGCGNYSCSTTMDNVSTAPTSFNGSYQEPFQEKAMSISMFEFVLEILGLSAITVFGMTMNLLIAFLFIKYPKSRSSASLLIMNLTATDLISCITILPMTIYGISVETWTHGPILCMMAHALLSIPYCVSFWGHLGLAVCRYCLFNFKSKISKVILKQSSITVAIIFMWLLQIGVHWALLWTPAPMADVQFLPEYGVCGTVTTTEEGNLVISTTLTLIIMLPFIACIIIYAIIAYRVRRQVDAFPTQLARRRYMQMSKYTTFLFGFFCLSWLPDYLRIVIDIDGQAPIWVIRLGNFLYYLNCAANPYIYALRCDPVRKAFVLQFPILAKVFRLHSNQIGAESGTSPSDTLATNQPGPPQNVLLPRMAIATISTRVTSVNHR